MKWRIYYGDGTTFDGAPEKAPTTNVQAIAWNDPEHGTSDLGRVVLHQYDIYLYSDHVGGWHATNKYADLMQHLFRGCGPGGVRAVLQGSWIPTTTFKEILHRAENEPPLDRKSARNPFIEDGSQ